MRRDFTNNYMRVSVQSTFFNYLQGAGPALSFSPSKILAFLAFSFIFLYFLIFQNRTGSLGTKTGFPQSESCARLSIIYFLPVTITFFWLLSLQEYEGEVYST